MKYSRLVFMDFSIKDLRANPSQEGVFYAEQATDLKILQLVMGMRHQASLITHGSGDQGKILLGRFILGVSNEVQSSLAKVTRKFVALNKEPRFFSPSHFFFFLIFFFGQYRCLTFQLSFDQVNGLPFRQTIHGWVDVLLLTSYRTCPDSKYQG